MTTEAISPDAGPAKQAQVQLTLGRVKSMIKEDVEVKSISTEACFAITKATEHFLESVASRAAQHMLNENRAMLSYGDVANVVADWRSLDFLDEIVPQKVSAATVLARMEAAAKSSGLERAAPEARV